MLIRFEIEEECGLHAMIVYFPPTLFLETAEGYHCTSAHTSHWMIHRFEQDEIIFADLCSDKQQKQATIIHSLLSARLE